MYRGIKKTTQGRRVENDRIVSGNWGTEGIETIEQDEVCN
jgi:hypothetical protein